MDKYQILTLLNTKGIGKGTVRKALDMQVKATNIKELRSLIEDMHQTNKRIKIPSSEELEDGLNIAEEVIEKSEKAGIKILSQNDIDFPSRYKSIPDSPVLIHVLGNSKCLNELKSIAIIGTREPSEYGYNMGKRYATLLAEHKINVISGLAKGCDKSAHEGCIEGGGVTVSILAGGLEKIYPKENQKLSERIIETGGALVSEYQLGTVSLANYFVERDRLQCGLSKVLLVIETDIKGGSMHTVRFAQEQNRPIYVDYTKSDSRAIFPKFQGNKFLVESGKAIPISDKESFEGLIRFISENNSPSAGTIDKNLNNQFDLFSR